VPQLFDVQLRRSARRDLRKLTPHVLRAAKDVFTEMEFDPFGGDLETLGDGGYRRRIGKYRILFDVDTDLKVVFIAGVKPRGQAYK
jgi:mRNA-degrading endonuclease RelE of RelBE toxin-antitoxin system